MSDRQAIGRWLALVLVVGAVLFVVASIAERGTGGHDEGAAALDGDERAEHAEDTTVLGLDLESPVLVTIAATTSVALAASVLRSRGRVVVGAIFVFAVAFASLDIAELVRRIGEAGRAWVVLVGVVAAVHAAAAATAALAWRGQRSTD